MKKANQKKRDTLDKGQSTICKTIVFIYRTATKAIDAYIMFIDKEKKSIKAYSPNCIADYFRDYFKAEKEEGKDKEFGW